MSKVQVAVRARPLSEREIELESEFAVEMREKSTILFKSTAGVVEGDVKKESKEFVYDYSYWSVAERDPHFVNQEQVFNDLGKTVIGSAFEGYNVCVFAYGQTGSGKTYTMMGSPSSPGLIPRICEGLFNRIAEGNRMNVSYKLEACYMEIYNEKVRDLLKHGTPKSGASHNLKVREHPRDGPYVENLSKHAVVDYTSIKELMDEGNLHRVTASTKMNDTSSRSHAIFTITFTQATFCGDLPCETVSKINLVDLAGSERASVTGAEGVRLKEGGSINRSLVCLGSVISALADLSSETSRQKKPFVPYRDSTLTWLLKDSLGGNSRTIMVATISPAKINYGETQSTLRYASRAKNIINKPTVNEDKNVKLIRELRAEILRLKAIISSAQLGAEATESLRLAVDIQEKEEQIAELTRTWAGKWKDIQKLIEERDLALHSEGIKMTVTSEQPHFLGVDQDILSTGLVIYQLQKPVTTVGNEKALPLPDIALSAPDIEAEHCLVESIDGVFHLRPLSGGCCLNGSDLSSSTKLSQGDMLQLGESTLFRFNNPQEAKRLRQQGEYKVKRISPLTPPFGKSSSQTALDYESKLETLKELERKEEENAELREELERLKLSVETSDTESEAAAAVLTLDNEPYNVMRSIGFSPLADLAKFQESSNEVNHVDSNSATLSSELESSTESNTSEIVGYKCLEVNADGEYTTEGDLVLVETLNSRSFAGLTKSVKVEENTSPISFSTRSDYALESRRRLDFGKAKAEPMEDTLKEQVHAKHGSFENTLEYSENQEKKWMDMKKQLVELEQQRVEREHFHDKQRERYSNDRRKLRRQVDNLEKQLRDKEVVNGTDSSPETRVRSCAFGEADADSLAYRSLRKKATPLTVSIPCFILRGKGMHSYHVYQVKLKLGKERWSVYRRFQEFQNLHQDLTLRYAELSALSVPPSKWFWFRSVQFVNRRRQELERYIKSLIAVCSTIPSCPLSESKLSKEKLFRFHSFFTSDAANSREFISSVRSYY